MKKEQAVKAILAITSTYERWAEWEGRDSEGVARRREEVLAQAQRAVELSAGIKRREVPDVVWPADLVRALKEVSCAPAVGWVLDLTEAGLTLSDAICITDAIEAEEYERESERGNFIPWGWSDWVVVEDGLIWNTGSRRTHFRFGVSGAVLERYGWGDDQVTGAWTWSAEGHLEEGWVHPWDQRAEQLTSLFGAVAESPEDSQLAQELELQALTADRKEALQALKGRARRKEVNTERAARARHRTIKRNADRRRKAADTWDRPVA